MRTAYLVMAVLAGALGFCAPRAPGESQAPLRIVTPRHGAIVSGIVPIVVEASDALEVSFVVFGIDGQRPASMNTRPYKCYWDTRTYSDGPHVLFVEGYRQGGLVASAGPIQVIVRNQAPAPSLLASPQVVASRVLLPAPPSTPAAAPLAAERPGPSLVLADRKLPIVVRILEGHGYVPVRPVVEGLQGLIDWDQQTHSATAWARDREVRLVLGSPIAILNGSPVRLWRAPTLEANRMVLPARGCAHLFDLSVAWDAVWRVIRLGVRGEAPSEKPTLVRAPG